MRILSAHTYGYGRAGLTPLEQIFATLAEHGRLAVRDIAQHTQTPLRRIRHCLASLLEQQLVLHANTETDAPTFYAVNWRAIYGLARRDNIAQLVTERFDEGAGQIVNNIQQLGLARVGDLADAYQFSAGSKRDSGVDTTSASMVNGTTKAGGHAAQPSPAVPTIGSFHATMRRLLQSGILVKVTTRTFLPPSDLQEQMEETIIGEQFPDRKITGPKKQSEFKKAVNSLKRRWREDDEYSDSNDLGARSTFNPPNKRIKGNGVVSYNRVPDDDDSGPRLSVR